MLTLSSPLIILTHSSWWK